MRCEKRVYHECCGCKILPIYRFPLITYPIKCIPSSFIFKKTSPFLPSNRANPIHLHFVCGPERGGLGTPNSHELRIPSRVDILGGALASIVETCPNFLSPSAVLETVEGENLANSSTQIRVGRKAQCDVPRRHCCVERHLSIRLAAACRPR